MSSLDQLVLYSLLEIVSNKFGWNYFGMELVPRELEQNDFVLANGTKFKLEYGYDFDSFKSLFFGWTDVCCIKVSRVFRWGYALPPGEIKMIEYCLVNRLKLPKKPRNSRESWAWGECSDDFDLFELLLVESCRRDPWLLELLYFMEAGPHSPVPGSEAEFQLHIVKMNNPIHLLSVIAPVYAHKLEVAFYRTHSNIEESPALIAIEADEDRREFRLFIRLIKQPAYNVSHAGNPWNDVIWFILSKLSVITCAMLMKELPTMLPCLPNDYYKRGHMRNLYPLMVGMNKQMIFMIQLIQELNIIHSSQPWIDSNYLAKFYSIKKGLCIIINQQNFTKEDGSKHEREGSDVDVGALHNTFHIRLGFDVDIYVDLTADQLRQLVIKDLPQKVNNVNDYGSLVVCILSHGSKEVVCGVDWKPVEIIDELIYAINDQTCPQLKDKPKLWITQACQKNSRPTQPTPSIYPCKVIGDCLWLSSTIPGFVSKRNKKSGSRFIQTLCKYMDAVTPGKPVKDVIKVHEKTTGELKVRLDQIPNVGLKSTVKAVGFLPTSDGKEKTRCFFPKNDPKLKTLAKYLESTGATFDYDPPVTPVPSP